jgi:hypothetical protein
LWFFFKDGSDWFFTVWTQVFQRTLA